MGGRGGKGDIGHPERKKRSGLGIVDVSGINGRKKTHLTTYERGGDKLRSEGGLRSEKKGSACSDGGSPQKNADRKGKKTDGKGAARKKVN